MLYNIYKLVSQNSDLVYVGRTVRTLTERFTQHRNHSNPELKYRCSSWKVLEHGNCSIVFIEETEDPKREKYWIEELGACNTNKLTGDYTESLLAWKQKNREKRRAYASCRNKLPVTCDRCGLETTKGNLCNHQKTKRCQKKSQEKF